MWPSNIGDSRPPFLCNSQLKEKQKKTMWFKKQQQQNIVTSSKCETAVRDLGQHYPVEIRAPHSKGALTLGNLYSAHGNIEHHQIMYFV